MPRGQKNGKHGKNMSINFIEKIPKFLQGHQIPQQSTKKELMKKFALQRDGDSDDDYVDDVERAAFARALEEKKDELASSGISNKDISEVFSKGSEKPQPRKSHKSYGERKMRRDNLKNQQVTHTFRKSSSSASKKEKVVPRSSIMTKSIRNKSVLSFDDDI